MLRVLRYKTIQNGCHAAGQAVVYKGLIFTLGFRQFSVLRFAEKIVY